MPRHPARLLAKAFGVAQLVTLRASASIMKPAYGFAAQQHDSR
jgi:hypothetical protein